MMQPLPIAFLMTLAACGHTAPSSAGPGDLEGPFQSTEPLRLTYSPGADRTPLWSIVPDRVMYAYDHEPVPGGVSGCVADLPVGGGSRGLELCDTDVDYAQTIMRPFWPARRPDGATAMIRQRWAPMGIAPFFSDLAIQPGGQGQVPRTILPIPYFSSATGRTHQGVSHLQWLDGDHLVYLALAVIRSQNDNVETGLEIVILTPASPLCRPPVEPRGAGRSPTRTTPRRPSKTGRGRSTPSMPSRATAERYGNWTLVRARVADRAATDGRFGTQK